MDDTKGREGRHGVKIEKERERDTSKGIGSNTGVLLTQGEHMGLVGNVLGDEEDDVERWRMVLTCM